MKKILTFFLVLVLVFTLIIGTQDSEKTAYKSEKHNFQSPPQNQNGDYTNIPWPPPDEG